MDNTPVKVTIDYINKHKTEKGAWTRKQILALGIKWPPKSGWKQELDGTYITQEKAREFEDGKTQHAEFKPMKYKKILSSIEKLSDGQLRSVKQKIDQLLSK